MIHNTKLRDNISYASYVSNKQFDTINMLPLQRAEFVQFQVQQNNMLLFQGWVTSSHTKCWKGKKRKGKGMKERKEKEDE